MPTVHDPAQPDGPLRILLVEDNPGDARLLRELLDEVQDPPVELLHVDTLAGALESAGQDPPDVALLDLELPDSRGLDTVRSFLEACPSVPVVVLTGHAGGDVARRALRAGAQDYLVKGDFSGELLQRSMRYAVERKTATEKVAQEERRFHALAEGAPDAIVTIDTDSRIVYANPAVEEIFGHDPEALVGAPVTRLMPEEARSRHLEGLGRYLLAGERRLDWTGVELPAQRANGEVFPAEMSFAEYRVGRERYFTGIVRDVSERKQAERELRKSERRFRMLAEHIEAIFYLLDMRAAPGRLVYVSPAYEDVWGRQAEPLYDDWTRYAEGIHPEDRERVLEEIEQRFRGEQHSEYRILRPDGEVRWLRDDSYPVRDEDDAIAWVVGLARDITAQVELEEELKRERARFQEVFEDAPAFIATLRGPDHVFEMANPAYRDLVGHRDLVGRPKREVLGQHENEEVLDALDRVYETGEPVHLQEVPSNPGGDGRLVYCDVSYIPREEDGATVGVLILGTDVTAEVEARKEAERSEELLSRVFETVAEGIVLADEEGVFRFANEATGRLLGRGPEEIVGTLYNDGSWRISAPDGGPFSDRELPVARVLRTGEPVYGVEHAVERPDGSRIILSVNAAPFRTEDGRQGVVASIRDVTEQKEFEAQLEHRALHDYLTDLPNRALLRDRLEHALDRTRRTGEKLAVLFLDLDRFKTVNDSLGHEAGDRVLEEIARRLAGAVRDRDTVARVGGDEFTLLLEDVTDEAAARQTADRLLEAISAPITVGADRVRLDASVGLALHDPAASGPEAGATPGGRPRGTDLVRRADRAMFRVKSLAGQRIGVAGDAEDEDLARVLSQEMRLREAVEGGELGTVYQPVFDLSTGHPVAAEALARWEDPERGAVPPGRFIPMAEETGLIVPLGEQQLERACRDASRWSTAGTTLQVRVNISTRQLSDPTLLDSVRGALERTAFPVERLTLEVTESAAMREARKMDALKEMGLSLSVDDFGTRYSTLAQVKRLNVDSLKIDRSFVEHLVEDRRDRAIVEATLTLGRALGLRVVAEGIEMEEQLQLLRELGCPEGQGFGLARPMTSDDLMEWLRGGPVV